MAYSLKQLIKGKARVKAILSEACSDVGHLFCSPSSTNDLLSYGGKTDEVTHAGSWFKAHLVCAAFLLALKTQGFCLCGCLPRQPIWSLLDFSAQQISLPADFLCNKNSMKRKKQIQNPNWVFLYRQCRRSVTIVGVCKHVHVDSAFRGVCLCAWPA